MEDQGFYVTLPCNASLDVYPENRISSYRTRLSTTINLKGKWDVALAEIEYPKSWYTLSDKDGGFTLYKAPLPTEKEGDKPGEKKKIRKISGTTVRKELKINGGYYATIYDVILEVNKVLAKNGELRYDELRNKVYLVAIRNIAVGFYGKLATILGVKPDDPLGREDYHAEADFTTSVNTYAPYQADINAGLYTIYVYTDIIQYQAVGDSHVPLLRCVHISGENKETVSVRYDKPHYVPVNKELITDIVVELKDDHNCEIPFSYGKVVVKLHFKPSKHSIL